jgi:hypothetical protein
VYKGQQGVKYGSISGWSKASEVSKIQKVAGPPENDNTACEKKPSRKEAKQTWEERDWWGGSFVLERIDDGVRL